MSKPTDRPEFSFVIGLGIGLVAMAVFVAAMLATDIRSGFYGIVHEPLPHAIPHWTPK